MESEDDGIVFSIYALASVFLAIGLPMVIYSIFKNNKKEKLINEGQRIVAEIVSIEIENNVTINGRHPYHVYCRYKNPSDGDVYKFMSDMLTFNPNDSYKVGDSVDVYVKPDNMEYYYVNVIDKSAIT